MCWREGRGRSRHCRNLRWLSIWGWREGGYGGEAIPRPPAPETAMARERPETVRIGAAIMSGALVLQKGNMEVRMAVSGDIFFWIRWVLQ